MLGKWVSFIYLYLTVLGLFQIGLILPILLEHYGNSKTAKPSKPKVITKYFKIKSVHIRSQNIRKVSHSFIFIPTGNCFRAVQNRVKFASFVSTVL